MKAKPWGALSPIETIPHDGGPQTTEVCTHLMHSAGVQLRTDKGFPFALPEDLYIGVGRLGLGLVAGRDPHAAPVSSEGQATCSRTWHTYDDREVGSRHRVLPEAGHQFRQSARVSTSDHEAARRRI